MTKGVCVALLLWGCATTPPPAPVEDKAIPVDGPKLALAKFLVAVEARDFENAFRLLGKAWRDRYGSAARLARDFEAEPAVSDRLARIKAAATRLVEAGQGASLEWAPG
ncbi:MAG TPA: hypothetical protein VGE37_06680, partial [Archangium sp.]